MTTLEEQLDTLRQDSLSFDLTEAQRDAARAAFDAIANTAIQAAIGELQQGTAVYQKLTAQLAAVIDDIHAMPDILGKTTAFIGSVNEAVGGNNSG